MINIVIAYATPEKQREIPLQIEPNCNVAVAIRRSGVLSIFPEINLANCEVGIWSKKVGLDHALQEGDRIEIYRPLIMDPKTARRLRLQKKR